MVDEHDDAVPGAGEQALYAPKLAPAPEYLATASVRPEVPVSYMSGAASSPSTTAAASADRRRDAAT